MYLWSISQWMMIKMLQVQDEFVCVIFCLFFLVFTLCFEWRLNNVFTVGSSLSSEYDWH
jgi:hypothetical protein